MYESSPYLYIGRNNSHTQNKARYMSDSFQAIYNFCLLVCSLNATKCIFVKILYQIQRMMIKREKNFHSFIKNAFKDMLIQSSQFLILTFGLKCDPPNRYNVLFLLLQSLNAICLFTIITASYCKILQRWEIFNEKIIMYNLPIIIN